MSCVLDELFCACAQLLHFKWVKAVGSTVMNFGDLLETTLLDVDEVVSGGEISTVGGLRSAILKKVDHHQ